VRQLEIKVVTIRADFTPNKLKPIRVSMWYWWTQSYTNVFFVREN